jgi:hypothetical protein
LDPLQVSEISGCLADLPSEPQAAGRCSVCDLSFSLPARGPGQSFLAEAMKGRPRRHREVPPPGVFAPFSSALRGEGSPPRAYPGRGRADAGPSKFSAEGVPGNHVASRRHATHARYHGHKSRPSHSDSNQHDAPPDDTCAGQTVQRDNHRLPFRHVCPIRFDPSGIGFAYVSPSFRAHGSALG